MKIVQYPHPSLRHAGQPVRQIDKQLRLQIGEMFDLMYEAKGLGLAATQVALPMQFVVMNLRGDPDAKDAERVYVNPLIIRRKGVVDDEEGCLSFPGMFARVKRAKQVVLQAFDLNGEAVELTATDLEARAWEHEIDHLNGVLFIDRFSPLIKVARHGEIKSFESKFRKAQSMGEIPPDADIEKFLHAIETEMER